MSRISVLLLLSLGALLALATVSAHSTHSKKHEDPNKAYVANSEEEARLAEVRAMRRAYFKRMLSSFGPTEPQAIHIALAGADATGLPNGMTVSWLTAQQTPTSTVKYGTTSGHYDHQAMGTQNTYIDSFNHHVVLRELKYNTRYYYICGDDTGGYSTEYSFVSNPQTTDPFTVNVYGDMGASYSDDTRARLQNQIQDVSLMWHIGDMSYADDDLNGNNYQAIWDAWQNQMMNMSAYTPYMVLPGNHEAECHFFGCLPLSKTFYKLNNFTAYRHRFRMPYEESGSASNMWYSFNYGPVHFVSISTETDFPGSPEGRGSLANYGPFGDQLTWLENDLKAAVANRSSRPWILVAGHRPIYSLTCKDSNGNPTGSCKSLQTAIEGLMQKYQVDIFFAGHVHSYQRTTPVFQGKPTQGAPVHIIHGAAGNIEGHSGLPGTAPWLAAKDDTNFGYGRLTIFNSTTLRWRFHRNSDDAVQDEVVLTTKHTLTQAAPEVAVA